MSESKDFKIVKLEKNNYVVWKWQFINVLRAKKLMKVVQDIEVDEDMDAQALALLGSALSEENMLKISNCETFKDAWKAIGQCFENKTAYEPQALYRRLNSFKINSAADVSQGLSELRGIVAQLKNLNETVSDHCLIGAILSSLPNSFDIFVTVWKNSADSDVDNLVSKLMAEASDQVSKENEEAKGQALISRRGKPTKKDGKRMDKDQCRYCKETGHWIKDCPNLKKPYDPDYSKKRKNKEDSKKETDNENDTKGFAFVTQMSAKSYPPEIWVADSGCTNHMTPYEHLFVNVKHGNYGNVQMADESKCIKASGIGDIITKYGRLQNVLYVPELTQSLFSISAAANAGLNYVGQKDKIIFYHQDKELFTAHLEDKLYLIEFKINSPQVKAATLNEWHARFNHASVDAIKLMGKNNVVNGLNVVSNTKTKCIDCSMNKCTRVDHPTRTSIKAKKAGRQPMEQLRAKRTANMEKLEQTTFSNNNNRQNQQQTIPAANPNFEAAFQGK